MCAQTATNTAPALSSLAAAEQLEALVRDASGGGAAMGLSDAAGLQSGTGQGAGLDSLGLPVDAPPALRDAMVIKAMQELLRPGEGGSALADEVRPRPHRPYHAHPRRAPSTCSAL